MKQIGYRKDLKIRLKISILLILLNVLTVLTGPAQPRRCDRDDSSAIRYGISVGGSATVCSSLTVGKRPTSTNLHTIAGWDSANDTVKQMSIDSLTGGSVAHGVTPGTVPKSLDSTHWTDSRISENDDSVIVFNPVAGSVFDTITDDFVRTVDPLDSGWQNCPSWSDVFRTQAGSAVNAGNAMSVRSGMFYRNQFSWINCGGVVYQYVIVSIKMSTDTCSKYGFFFLVNIGGKGYLYKRGAGGVQTIIDSTVQTSESPTYVWMQSIDDTIKCYCYGMNGNSPVITRYDNSILGGSVGMGCSQYASIGTWKGGGSTVNYDSIFKINGRISAENTPTTTTGTRVMIKNDEPDNVIRQMLASTLNVDSASASGSVDGYSASNSTVTSTSYFTAPDNDTLKRISISNTLASLGLADSLITKKVSSSRIFQDSIWHAYGGFRDSAVTISISTANDWQQVTNAAHTLWGGDESDGISLSGDTMIFAHSGDYHGTAKICYSALNAKDFSVRFYNVTQSDSMDQGNIPSTTGAGNIQCVTQPLYFEITAGDRVIMQITCNTDGTDPVIKSGRFELSYLHD